MVMSCRLSEIETNKQKNKFHCKKYICIIVYRLHVTITYQTQPIHVRLNSNILIHTLHQIQHHAIRIIRTVAQKDQPIHRLLSAKVLLDQAVTTTQLTVHQPLARVLVTTVTVQPLLAACLTVLRTVIIHTASKHCTPSNLNWIARHTHHHARIQYSLVLSKFRRISHKLNIRHI